MIAAFCFLVFFIKYTKFQISNSLVYSLQVGLIVLFQVRWAPERMYRLANLLNVRL